MHLFVCSLLSIALVCNAGQCISERPYIEEPPTSITTSHSAYQLKAAASCRYLSVLLDTTTLLEAAKTAASYCYTHRQDLTELHNAVKVLHQLRVVRNKYTSEALKMLHCHSTSRIAPELLYDIKLLDGASSARRSEAVVDMLRIMQTSHPRGLFRSLETFCPDLVEVWERSKLVILRCRVSNAQSVTWYRNGFPLKPSHRLTSYHHGPIWYLNIVYPRILDVGWYSCEARSSCAQTKSEDATVGFLIEGSGETERYPLVQCSGEICAVSGVHALVHVSETAFGELMVENATIDILQLSNITTERVTVTNCIIHRLVISDMHGVGRFSLMDTAVGNIEVDRFDTKEMWFYELSVASGHFSDVRLEKANVNNCGLYNVSFVHSELREVSMLYVVMNNAFLSHVALSNLTETMTVEENSTWENFTMTNVNSFNTLKRNVTYDNTNWYSRWCAYGNYLDGRYIRCIIDYDPHSYCLCRTVNVTNYKVTNGTFVGVSYTNVIITQYMAVDSTFVNCLYTNVAIHQIALLGISAINQAYVNVTSLNVANVNSTWINMTSINSALYQFLEKNVKYINLYSQNAIIVNGTLIEVNYTNVESVNDSWRSIFINQLWEADVTKTNFISASIASFNITRHNVLFINSRFFWSTDWNATHVNVRYSDVVSARCVAVNVTEISETVVDGTYIDYSSLNVTTIRSRKTNVSYLWASQIFEFSSYVYCYRYHNCYPYFYQFMYVDYVAIPFLPIMCGSWSWCNYYPWRWPSYSNPRWRTWWHADIWKQSQEELSGWSSFPWDWFQPTDGLFYVWHRHISNYEDTRTDWPREWGLRPRNQAFHNLVVINSTLVDTTYNDTVFTNLTLVNTNFINSTFTNLTTYSSNLVNVVFYNVSFLNFIMTEYSAIDVTEIMTVKAKGMWYNCTYIDSTFIASTNLNCTLTDVHYFNTTYLGCNAVQVQETDLLDINGKWIDYKAFDVTTTRALRRHVSFSNSSKWWNAYINALQPLLYISKEINQTIESLGQKFYSQVRNHAERFLVNATDRYEYVYRWWGREDWWRLQQWWLQDWWTNYCSEVRDPELRELWPCGNSKNVHTLSVSSLIDSTYISVVMRDISAYDFTIFGSTFYHVRWSGGRSSHVAVRQSVGVSVILENHKSIEATFVSCYFYVSSMINCVHKAPRARDTYSYWSSSYNNYYDYSGVHFWRYYYYYYYTIPTIVYDRLPNETYALLNEGGWCAVVQWHQRDGHCQTACDTSDRCVS